MTRVRRNYRTNDATTVMNGCCRSSISCVNNYDQRGREASDWAERGRTALQSAVWRKQQSRKKQGGKLFFIPRRSNRFQTTFGLAGSNKHLNQYSFIMSTNRSLDRLILSKASHKRLPDSKKHSSCEKEYERADSFGSMSAPQTCYRGAASLTLTFYSSMGSMVHAWFHGLNK